MRLGFIPASKEARTDTLLNALVTRVRGQNLRVCGAVQSSQIIADRDYCDIELEVLPKGEIVGISQDLGSGADSCRLDQGELETIVQTVEDELAKGADLLIVNRFGRRECEGRGFRAAIGAALEADIPVLVGVNEKYRDGFLAFADGMAEEVEPKLDVLSNWLTKAKKP